MSQPKELISDEKLVNYLLGLLPEDEAECLDEASIVDDDVAAQLCAVENDLVDAYVMETLDHDTRARFESCYLTSSRRREKVKFAKRFLSAVDRASTPPVAPLVAVAQSSSERVRRFPTKSDTAKSVAFGSKYNWPLLTVAASVVLACGVLVNDLQLRQGLNRARRAGADNDRRAEQLTGQLDQARNENIEMTQALERARAAASNERPAVSVPPAASASLSSTAAIATALFPQTRSIRQVPKIEVAAGSKAVQVELRLESNEFTQYRAVLKETDTGRIAWRSALVHARSGSPASVSLVVPADALESRHYSFELAGVDAAGHQTITSTYALQIDRR